MKTWLILLFVLLTGCASPRAPVANLSSLFADASFAPPSEPTGATDLFRLSEPMREYVRSPAFLSHLRLKGARQGLVDALYKAGELKLEYESTMTRNAAQTFEARSGNCLSLVIMTAAFARELDMPVVFNAVNTDEMWSRQGGLYLASTHVNISIGYRPNEIVRGAESSPALVVDFLPPEDVIGYDMRPIPEDEIVALYMNNRAAESLVQGRLDDAYWWARSALLRQPQVATAYNTLGVIYQRRARPEMAERALRAALQVEPRNVVAMQNLVPVLRQLGKDGEAQALGERVARLEPNPPYHYFNEGMRAFEQGDFLRAKKMFGREVRRAPYNDEFHFWLALTHLRLGETVPARQQMALARDTSTRGEARARYASKLAYLKAGPPKRR